MTSHETARKQAYMQVTRECNNECVFCSNPQFEKSLSLEEMKGKVIGFKKMGITDILLTGGEPTLLEPLAELVRYINERGMRPKVITNGVLLSKPEIPRLLFESGLSDVNVSIHSDKEEIADRLSQRKGHFNDALQGIRNAIDTGMHVTVNSTINSMNCKRLPSFVEFITGRFPEVGHFVFNGLDPGKADGKLMSRAGMNPWIVPKLTDFEIELRMMADRLIERNKTFRVERVPLCYMGGFEEFSTETRKIVKGEKYICLFMDGKDDERLRIVDPAQRRMKAEPCKACALGPICAGVQLEYASLHGTGELYPVFTDPEEIRERILHHG